MNNIKTWWFNFILISTTLLICPNNLDAEEGSLYSGIMTKGTAIATIEYLKKIEEQNKISYSQIVNTAGSYIPSMCYTKTSIENEKQQNPCYACHIQGVAPNYNNTTHLQLQLNFPPEMRKNPYSNLFKEEIERVSEVFDKTILNYIRESNYQEGNLLILNQSLPEDWSGYRPDAFYQFDNEGFDHKPDGSFTLWRAYRYYPFLGTFWPTNGSTNDVLIRLAQEFSINVNSQFDVTIYKINLAIVESLIKLEDIKLNELVDEKIYGVDLNKNGKLDISHTITFPPRSYVGAAKLLQKEGKVHLAPGLFPEKTEFLHSVRYLDWDTRNQKIRLSARMKELRYSKKYQWFNYSELKNIAQKEFLETQDLDDSNWNLDSFRGSPTEGLRTDNGWVLQGFIEDNTGQLRPQTREETIYCMGCHSGTGATVDASFSFARKFSSENNQNSWQHWSQKDMVGVKEQKQSFQNHTNIFEYSFYLKNNPTGNELANNSEVRDKFFDKDGNAIAEQFSRLHNDISILLYPTYDRAMELNKGYKFIVEDQSFIYGREGNIAPLKNVYKTVKKSQPTGLKSIISRYSK